MPWFTDENGREIDLDAFPDEASLRAALDRPTGPLCLTDAAGRSYDVVAIYGPAQATTGPYTARPAAPGEVGEFPWVVAHGPDGRLVAEADEETAVLLARTLNAHAGPVAEALTARLDADAAGRG
jgi:hypothetical protein